MIYIYMYIDGDDNERNEFLESRLPEEDILKFFKIYMNNANGMVHKLLGRFSGLDRIYEDSVQFEQLHHVIHVCALIDTDGNCRELWKEMPVSILNHLYHNWNYTKPEYNISQRLFEYYKLECKLKGIA